MNLERWGCGAIYPRGIELATIASERYLVARHLPMFRGTESDSWIIPAARFYISELGALCVFTLDTGHHTCGWWKNPDYETCWHLSISFRDIETWSMAPLDRKAAGRIVRAFYLENASMVWCEPPATKQGKESDCWHYRLFIDTATLVPLLPRGEVYSREFTESGWKSFSELAAVAPPGKASTR